MTDDKEQHYLDLIDENRELSYEVARLKKLLEIEKTYADAIHNCGRFWRDSYCELKNEK